MKTTELNHLKDIVNSLLFFKGSTTHFLESLRNENLKVMIKNQKIKLTIIERKTVLYFATSELPLIYSTSYLNTSQLLKEEYELIKAGDIPLGKIFIQLNNLEDIKKENISCSSLFDMEANLNLNIEPSMLYKKRYDFKVAGRNVGEINELFNSETLKRIY